MRNWFYFLLLSLTIASCGQNNVKVDNSLKKFFDNHHVQGSFGLFNNGNGEFTIYNLNRFKDSAFMPASTYDIVNALIALESGKITDEKMVIKWDGVTRSIPGGDTTTTWNKDLTIEEAFKASSVPHYQEIARRIGKDTMQFWLDTLGYGSRYQKPKIGKIDSFWLDNSVKVTADEQLGLVKKLYFDQLPFQKRSMRIMKDVMVMEKNANYTLAYKTGLGFLENGNAMGWIIGWVIENQHPYFFALNADGNYENSMRDIRMHLFLKDVLKQQGFLQGKM